MQIQVAFVVERWRTVPLPPSNSTLISRFEGDRGRALLLDELRKAGIVTGIADLPEALADAGVLQSVSHGQILIEQNGADNDVYFVVAGIFGIFVNERKLVHRNPGDTVGEMATVSPIQRRAATVIAEEDAVVLKLSEQAFSEIATRFPDLWRRIAQVLSKRLEQRNVLIRQPNDKIRVFVISSVEALPVARAIENAFAHDPFATIVWANGVFRVTNYTLESLENELDMCDFAVAIAHPDDKTKIRDEDWPTPRDNVVFELGFFMGRLGRSRAILMEPQGARIKLPSDLAGVTTIRYRFETKDTAALMGPACNELREHIMKLGRNI
jgi:CRP/FNR family cyclic AMP-dependent transcriptional regulator